ncbi:MAG: fibronectin type III domain-containing protein [Verrucomicrobiae bacterium]|nr:fibronectin type III domain-containing protein [Verrucomicrobiae bacterium]
MLTVNVVLQRAGMAAIACTSLASLPLRAQLFDGGGLFNRKTDPPRAQTEEEIGVPTPVTGRVQALKGHEVTFEIRAESKTPGATVEFLIRAFPSAGKIVSLVSKPNERNKALVTYWADPASSATEDAFSFAVRYRGGRYSSEMRYDIDLTDLKTEIQVPAQLEFGEVMIGGEEVREVTVRNLGNGSMERQLFLAPPWHLVDPVDGKISLGPRGARVLKIAFRPELTGETSYFLSFSRSKAGTTKLSGAGKDPFAVVTETLELVLDEESNERRGEIGLSNSGQKPMEVAARASTRLQQSLQENYLLAPGQVTKIPVKLAATDTAPFDGNVEFFLKNGYARSARVIAPVVPGRLVVSIPGSLTSEVINFGQVEAGRSVEKALTVTNPGGVAVPIEFHLPEPFRLLTNTGPQLGPLSSMNLTVGLFPTASQRGLVDVTMNIYGNDQTVPVRLLGNVIAPEGVSPGAPTTLAAPNLPAKGFRLGGTRVSDAKEEAGSGALPELPAQSPVTTSAGEVGNGQSIGGISSSDEDWLDRIDPRKMAELSSPLGFVARTVVEREIDPTIRRPEDLTVIKSSSSSLEIGWTAPRDIGPATYEVEMRALVVNPETGAAENIWAPFPVSKVEQIDRLVKARIDRLSPVTRYELRVILKTADGRSSPPSTAIVATTELPMDWTYLYLAFGLVLLIGLGLGIRKIYLDRRPEVYQTQYVDV